MSFLSSSQPAGPLRYPHIALSAAGTGTNAVVTVAEAAAGIAAGRAGSDTTGEAEDNFAVSGAVKMKSAAESGRKSFVYNRALNNTPENPSSNKSASSGDPETELKFLNTHVIIIDDSTLNRKYLRKTLRSIAPYLDIVEFEDGKPGVEHIKQLLLEQQEQDIPMPETIVFMDNIMIDLHGPEAAKQMREAGFKGGIIALTGNLVKEDVLLFLDAGADRLIGKPFAKQIIADALKDFCKSFLQVKNINTTLIS